MRTVCADQCDPTVARRREPAGRVGHGGAPRQRRSPRAVGRRFRPDIEGLRAVAVLLVVAYHCGLAPVRGGFVGVDVFFVISGFLITEQLYQELAGTGRISLIGFYARRVTRLLPAATIVVLATLAAAWHWLPASAARATASDALAAAFYMINFRLAGQGTEYLDPLREPSPLQHFWSLAVEEQFYLAWPVLLVLASLAWARRGRPSPVALASVLGLLGAASFGLCVWQTAHAPSWAYFASPARAWELIAGALVALAAGRPGRGPSRVPRGLRAATTWLGLATIVGAATWFTDATAFPGVAALAPVAGTALVIAGGCAGPRRGAGRLLCLAPMRELGRLSYSWYLWHWPVLVIAPHLLDHPPGAAAKAALMLAALVPASMSLAAVESRIRCQPALRRHPGPALIGLGGGLTAAVLGVVLLANALPAVTTSGTGSAADTRHLLAGEQLASSRARLADLVAASAQVDLLPANLTPALDAAADDYPRDGNCTAPLTEESINYNISMGCEGRGDRFGPTTVVLFGDSHAGHWFDAVNTTAEREHWRLVVFVKSGCTPADALTYRHLTRQPYQECARWREEALARIAALRPALVVMSSYDYAGNPLNTTGPAEAAWAAAWTRTVRRIRQAGARPVVIADTPHPNQIVPDCLAAHPRQIRRCDPDPVDAFDQPRRLAVSQAMAAQGVDVIDPRPWLCTDLTCPVVIGDTLVYRDGSHLTATFSNLLAPVLAADLTRQGRP